MVPWEKGSFPTISSPDPLHAYEFDVTSGQCLTQPAYSVERFEVRVEGDRILVSDETVQSEARGTAGR